MLREFEADQAGEVTREAGEDPRRLLHAVDGPRQSDVLGEELVDGARPGEHFAQGQGGTGDLSNAEEV